MKTKLSKQEILERVGTMAQLAGIRPYVLREGRKNGVSAADLWNGSGLSMTVLSDRASDIYSVTYQGRSLCWLSGVGSEIAVPVRGLLGGRFPEMVLVICGMAHGIYPFCAGRPRGFLCNSV